METRLAYYELEGAEEVWPQIVERFKAHLSRCGVPYFKDGDKTEVEFVSFCQQQGIRTYKKDLLEYSGKGPCDRPFYYLSVKDSRDYTLDSFRLPCEGEDGGMCLSQVEQIAPVVIEPRTGKLLEKNDILVRNYPFSPRVYLITKRLMKLLQSNHASGCSFRACVVAGGHRGLVKVSALTAKPEAEADYFQLSIVSKVVAPPHVGRMRKSRACPKCNSVEIAITELQTYFRTGDLAPLDFQYSNEMLTDNAGCLRLSGEVAIISGRILRLLIENGVKGLTRRYTDPPVEFEVVEFRDPISETSRAE